MRPAARIKCETKDVTNVTDVGVFMCADYQQADDGVTRAVRTDQRTDRGIPSSPRLES